MPARRWTALLGLLLGASSGIAACSLALPGELDRIECKSEGVVGPPVCDPGQVCLEGVCTACATSERCGNGLDDDCNGTPDDGCGDSGPGGWGESCAGDPDCSAGFLCADSRCTRTCCRSEDCGPGWVCGSAGLCQQAGLLNRSVGVLRAGELCSGPTDCRSGLCESGRCIDTCCAHSDCGGGLTCSINPSGNVCRPGTGLTYGSTCSDNDQCAANLCRSVATGVKLCSSPCCSSYDCGSFNVAGLRVDMACGYPNGVGAACISGSYGNGAVGTACTGGGDCRSGICSPDGACSDACCSDADCPSPGFHCRADEMGRGFCVR
ncbi:MAG: hypothetical protein R3B07_25045 [Polyangiaceae bacterium]